MYQFRVGDVELTVVSDGTMPLPAEALFPKARRGEWEPAIQPDERGQWVAGLNCLLVRAGGQMILIDTGASNRPTAPRRAPGQLLDNLTTLGVEPGDVDLVITTHGHWDHYGWHTREVGDRLAPTFPNATYLLPRIDWEYFRAPAQRIVFFEENFDPLLDAGALDFTEGDARITSELRLVPAPGHSPGQTCVVVESRGETAMHLADLVHHQAQLEHPDWVRDLDAQPELVPETRARLFKLAADLDARCLVSHVRYPGTGRVVRRDGGYTFALDE